MKFKQFKFNKVGDMLLGHYIGTDAINDKSVRHYFKSGKNMVYLESVQEYPFSNSLLDSMISRSLKPGLFTIIELKCTNEIKPGVNLLTFGIDTDPYYPAVSFK